MGTMEVVTHSAEETQDLGRRIGELLTAGDVCLLQGTLGAGKTTLAQGVAWGAGVTGYAHSPTFVIVHEYSGRIPLFHLDLYRLDGGSAEVQELGIDEMLKQGACMVEWPEKAIELFSEGHLLIAIEFGDGPDDRRLTLTSHGPRHDEALAGLQRVQAT